MTIELPQFSDSHRLTNSSIQTWKTCPRKFFIAYRLGIRKHASEPLRVGTAFHLGCELLANPEADDAAVRHAISKATFDEQESETVAALVFGWQEYWLANPALEITHAEIEFEVPIENPLSGKPSRTFVRAGKLDAIGKLPDGSIALVERKTTGEAIDGDADYWKKLTLDSQLSGYILAAQMKGIGVEKAVYDVVRKPQIRPKAVSKAEQSHATANASYCGMRLTEPCPERETPQMYAARLRQDMRERPTHYFGRREIVRLKADLKEFQAELWQIARSIREAQLDEREFGQAAWPRNTQACTGNFGRCEYLDICRGFTADPTQETPEGFIRVARCHTELSMPASGVDNATADNQ